MAISPVLLATSDFFRTGNYAEAALWILVAAMFGGFALKGRRLARRRCMLATAVFLAFGLSDVVEVRTGAWWRPWWLLGWKALCIVSMLWLLRDHIRARRRSV